MLGRLSPVFFLALLLAGLMTRGALAEANLFCIVADRNVSALQFQAVLPDDKSAFSKLEGMVKSDLFGDATLSERDVKLLAWSNNEVRILFGKTLPDGKTVEVEILAIERMGAMDYGGGYFVRYGGATVSGRIACTGG